MPWCWSTRWRLVGFEVGLRGGALTPVELAVLAAEWQRRRGKPDVVYEMTAERGVHRTTLWRQIKKARSWASLEDPPGRQPSRGSSAAADCGGNDETPRGKVVRTWDSSIEAMTVVSASLAPCHSVPWGPVNTSPFDTPTGTLRGADEVGAVGWTQSVRAVWRIWLLTRLLTLGAAAILALAAGEAVRRRGDSGTRVGSCTSPSMGTVPRSRRQRSTRLPVPPSHRRGTAGRSQCTCGLRALPALDAMRLRSPYALASRHVDQVAASRSVAYLALFPYAFFLQAFYSETAFLIVAMGACLAAERQRS